VHASGGWFVDTAAAAGNLSYRPTTSNVVYSLACSFIALIDDVLTVSSPKQFCHLWSK